MGDHFSHSAFLPDFFLLFCVIARRRKRSSPVSGCFRRTGKEMEFLNGRGEFFLKYHRTFDKNDNKKIALHPPGPPPKTSDAEKRA
jgi:hypothetical protein